MGLRIYDGTEQTFSFCSCDLVSATLSLDSVPGGVTHTSSAENRGPSHVSSTGNWRRTRRES